MARRSAHAATAGQAPAAHVARRRGRERSGLLFRAAAYETPDDTVLDRIEALLGLGGAQVLRYADKKRGQRRAVQLVPVAGAAVTKAESRLNAFLLAGDTSAQSWIKTLLQDELPAQAYGRLLLLPGAKAPLAVQSRGKPVCNCLNVTDSAIAAQLAAMQGEAGGEAVLQSEANQLAALQAALHCGTQCGSCVPELKRLVRASRPAAASRVIPIHEIST